MTIFEKIDSVKPELRVAFILMPNFTLIPVAGLVESLRFAADQFCSNRQVHCQWDWMTFDDLPVTASCGMRVAPTSTLSGLDEYDYVVLAGGLLDEVLEVPEWTSALVRTLHLGGKPLIALSCASFLLAEAGLLEGRRCSVHFTALDEFNRLFPSTTAVVDQTFVEDGNIISCSGGTAIELAAMLIERHCGAARASKGLDYLQFRPPSLLAPFTSGESHSGPIYENRFVTRAIGYMREHLTARISIQMLAEAVGIPERTLHRAFVSSTRSSPAQFWRELRLTRAKELLLNTDMHVTEIALSTGFSDASHFTLWFRKTFDETPCAFRKRRRVVDHLFRQPN